MWAQVGAQVPLEWRADRECGVPIRSQGSKHRQLQ